MGSKGLETGQQQQYLQCCDFSTWGPQWLGTQPKDPGVGGPVLDPRGITERPELGMGTRPHPGAYVILCRVRTPELQPSSMTPPLFNLVTQGPWEPSPWPSPVPELSSPPPRGLGCLHHQPPSNLGLAHHSEVLPGTAHPRALATGPQGCLGSRGTTGGLLPSSSGFIGPPAVGTREYLGRGDNVGNETWRGPPQGRRGPVV